MTEDKKMQVAEALTLWDSIHRPPRWTQEPPTKIAAAVREFKASDTGSRNLDKQSVTHYFSFVLVVRD